MTSRRQRASFSRAFAAGVMIAATLAGAPARATDAGTHETSAWRDIAWPLAFDPWPAGRAFRCDKASCGADVELYVRPKLGFCNCATGITDDSEIDLISDLAAISPSFAPRADGRAIMLADMKGRARPYLVQSGNKPIDAVAIILSKRCDAIVVTIATTASLPADIERAAMTLLASDRVLPWIEAKVGIPP
jgi:hypothetical protein